MTQPDRNIARPPTLTLAVALGDPQGIGPEVVAAALGRFLAEEPSVDVLIHGDADIFRRAPGAAAALSHAARLTFVHRPFTPDGPPPSAAGGAAALGALRAAFDDVRGGRADALVTAPLAKEAVARIEPGFTGHTAWLARELGEEAVMLLATERLRVFLVTDHLPLAAVTAAVTPARLERTIVVARAALQRFFGRLEPRIAVLGLNPHAGEGGELGREEIEVVSPVLHGLGGAAAGILGPYPADSFFRPGHAERFDGVVAMYHDQGLIPLKAAGFGAAVNVSLGLSIVRTSPDHGTAFDLAGRGVADAASQYAAFVWAARLARARGCPPCASS